MFRDELSEYQVSTLAKGLNNILEFRGTTPLTCCGSTERVMKAEAGVLNATLTAFETRRVQSDINAV